jgi:hypothetical protein
MPTREFDRSGRPKTIVADFRKYPDVRASFADYGATIARLEFYRDAVDNKDDPVGFIEGLAPRGDQSGWATDPKFVDKVLAIYRQWEQVLAQLRPSPAPEVRASDGEFVTFRPVTRLYGEPGGRPTEWGPFLPQGTPVTRLAVDALVEGWWMVSADLFGAEVEGFLKAEWLRPADEARLASAMSVASPSDTDAHLSPHFTLAALCKSEMAVRHGIDNTPRTPDVVDALRALAASILEPVRANFGIPFQPSSGYRCPELNDLLQGSENSQHMKGEAVDFEVPGVPNYQLALWIADKLDFDELILEYYESGKPSSGWVHCSYATGRNRKETMTFDGQRYRPGLIA